MVWCREERGNYLIGLKFSEEETAYAVRMVEQLCYIEHYKQNIKQSQGRELTGEEGSLGMDRQVWPMNFPHEEFG